MDIKAENNIFKYPIGILFNDMTSSCLEYVFLKNLLKNENILMLGNSTSGMKDLATVYKLNDRYTLSLTTKKYIYPNGDNILNEMIEPNINIPANINDFNKFPDKQLKRAICVIKESNKYKNFV